MTDERYHGICLKAIEYRDNDKLVTLYLEGKGKITATLRGCKSPKSKLRFAASPLCFAEYKLALSRGRYTVVGCERAELFDSLWKDIDKFYAAMSMLEVFSKFTYENEKNDILFLTLLKSLKQLKDGGDAEKTLAYYLTDAVSKIGYGIGAERCIKCGNASSGSKKFSLREGGIVCSDCGNGIALSSDVAEVLRECSRVSLSEFCDIERDKNVFFNIIYILKRYIEHILQEKIESLSQYLDIVSKNS